MKAGLRFLIVSCLVHLTACATLTSPARLHKLEAGSSYWFDYDASRRGMVLAATTNSQGRIVVRACAEPAPDVAMQMAAQAELNVMPQVGAPGGSGSGSGAQAAKLLSERSQMVMFFREALFRVCEISMNQEFPPEKLSELYTQIISTALRLGSDKALEVDIILAQAEKSRQEAELSAAQTRIKLAEEALAEAKNEVARERARNQLELAQLEKKVASTQLQRASQQVEDLMQPKAAALSEQPEKADSAEVSPERR
ncbi:hypothetical protein QSH18_13250 [Xanthomonas sp. NCPPB 2654]|uniref:hypothetical protein n=1 Tax=unclassified Xanthomonas TaxID=2643310 RepID=UPI0021E084BF|nr:MULTISPECIES: hypothetical protein [unclassified Xanthomonas]MDL5366568.1 hypothetical protein [Xanthomonas sp. NCPPB 2654]UYC21292.1 hypothetical protein NUG20_03020 [Xanthomonas sp. CFBP 8443]